MKICPIIDIDELLKVYKNPEVLIFDASNGNNARANYKTEHLEGSFFIDLNTHLADIKHDFANGGRHPLPDIKTFAKTLSNLGISKHHHIIIYDDKNGANVAARFWWMLKSAGHEMVQVLNGGLNEAKNKNFPMSSKIENVVVSPENYEFDSWKLQTININELEKVIQKSNYLVIDVREEKRYKGEIEPIDLIAGHIPGALNIPFTENLDENGLFLPPNELKKKYEAKFGIIDAENITIHCGSGVTACHTLLALAYAGIELPKLYVGSWSEWSRCIKTF